MSLVYTDIILKNSNDLLNAKSGLLTEDAVRMIETRVLVDTGAWTLVINEETREKLGLMIRGTEPGTLANGKSSNYELAGPVEVIWKNRRTSCDALIIPGANEILLGAIPLEGMDLMVCPKREEVVGAHGDEPLYRI